MKKLTLISVVFALVAAGVVIRQSAGQVNYVPKPVFCAVLSDNPCSMLPGYIGPDPLLKHGFGYSGLFGSKPSNAAGDVQTPFDNMAWQMFIALNWAASQRKNTPAQGLTAKGPRVFQTYRKVSALFGNSPVIATCPPAGIPVFNIGSDGNGKPMPNNEEYFQASTNLPLIDINGNWTLYERRVNDIEASYLLAPNGNSSQTLTTKTGQTNFIQSHPKGASFTPSKAVPLGTPGSIEIKTAWRIIDKKRGDDPTRYYTQQAIVAVPKDLVSGNQQICANVTLGLVGMHIIQRNPVDPKNPELLPQWIWATFEQVDNAPLAKAPCDVSNPSPNTCGPTSWINQPSCGPAAPGPPGSRYSYYSSGGGTQTNVAPVPNSGSSYPWNSTAPYSQGATTPATAMPQATRCWSIYWTTASLNKQWQQKLSNYNTPFQYYMLIGTQWGGNVEQRRDNPLPVNAVPAMLSNITLETYIQNYTGTPSNLPGPGSCVGCHAGAVLVAGNNVSSDFSFLPFLAEPETARSKMKTAR